MSSTSDKKNILIVDDDDELRELILIIVESDGYNTLSASSGQMALEILKKPDMTNKIDLIVLDIMMPVMDGLSFLHWLRVEAKLTIPVLVMSGRKTDSSDDTVLAAGATAIIYKPLEAQVLLEHIKKQLYKP